MITINSTLQDIMQLDYTSREMLLEILQKRQVEERREKMAEDAKLSLNEYQSGNTSGPLTADEIIERLNNLG